MAGPKVFVRSVYDAGALVVGGDLLCLFRVRRSANRSGNPTVADSGLTSYVLYYAELHAWIEMAHRSLIEINDAARR